MDKIGNTQSENKIFSSRLILAIGFVLVLLLILVVRLYNLQVLNYDLYAQEALGNQMRILPITPTRGKIFDRNGKTIATNQLNYQLTLVPEQVRNIAQTLLNLKRSGFINDKDISRFYKIRKRYKKFHNIPIKQKLSESQVAQILVSNQFLGVEVEPYFHRIYPNNDSVHSVGYVSRMNKKERKFYDKTNYLGTHFVGKIGIEKYYETLLHGTTGKKQIERNAIGRVVDTKVIEPALMGADLFLTIDSDLQQKATQLLAEKRGSMVMIEVKTGEVLAMVSTPNYDPNAFVNGISSKAYRKLQTSKDIPQLNRAIQGLYPPGSTIKPMVALAGLEHNFIKKSTRTFCPGYFKLPNYSRKFNDWKRTGHGHIDAQGAIAQSCDVFFYELADKMGIDQIHDNLQYFNFGAKTGIDIPGESRGVLPSKAWKKTHRNKPWYRGETLIAGIGQGFITVTPLQLAVATAALANQGRIFQPKLLKNIHLPNQPMQSVPNTPARQIPIKDTKNWATVIEGMKRTIYAPKGTARRLNKHLKYTLAGKTGTAQVFGLDAEEQYIASKYAERLRDHALFVGFAPIENPQVAVSVIVENAGSGSAKAAPLARQLLDVYFEKHPVQ